MQYLAVILGLAASATAQGVTAALTDGTNPAGCESSYPSSLGKYFTFNTQNITGNAKRDLEERQASSAATTSCGGPGSLALTLNNGILLDQKGRTGYIASNSQFQFDGPPQAGALVTAGWCAFENKTLALGGSVVFYNCLSGTFNNIYQTSQGLQCHPVEIVSIPCTPSGSVASSAETVSSTSENIMSMMYTSSIPTTSAPAPTTAAANTTAPVGTATAPSGTTTAPTTSPSPFIGGAAIVAAGQKLVGLVAGAAAFALL